MSELVMTWGLPASGKSTWAKEWQKAGGNRVIVCRDDLRSMLHDGAFSPSKEKFVKSLQNAIIREALEKGKSVVVADTNLHPSNEARLRAIAKEYGVNFRVQRFNTLLEEAIRRDLNRESSVGESVIRRMWRDYIKPLPTYTPCDWKPWCIIVDIDGTLANHNGERSPYDMTKVGNDTPNLEIIDLVKRYHKDHGIVVLSGRSSDGREDTIAWLVKYEVPFDHLFMREEGDKRKDSTVKGEMYEYLVEPRYNVRFVLDDRNQVVDMWREEYGLRVLQVAEGDF